MNFENGLNDKHRMMGTNTYEYRWMSYDFISLISMPPNKSQILYIQQLENQTPYEKERTRDTKRKERKIRVILVIYEVPKCFQGVLNFLSSFISLKYELPTLTTHKQIEVL